MIEINEMMTRRVFLDICTEIKGLCADLYHDYSRIYEDIPDASCLWKKTALEEENHQRYFKSALRLWNETEFEVMLDSMRLAYTIQFKLMELKTTNKCTTPDLLVAISHAVEMEEKIANLHIHTSLQFKEVLMQRLFKELGEADHDHGADLRRYKSSLIQPLSQMKEQ